MHINLCTILVLNSNGISKDHCWQKATRVWRRNARLTTLLRLWGYHREVSNIGRKTTRFMDVLTLSHLSEVPRACLLTDRMTEELRDLITKNLSLLLNEMLAIYCNQPISTAALHNNLKDLGLTCKRLKRIAAERDTLCISSRMVAQHYI